MSLGLAILKTLGMLAYLAVCALRRLLRGPLIEWLARRSAERAELHLLSEWEASLGMTPPVGSTIDKRRAAVLERLGTCTFSVPGGATVGPK